MPISDRLHPRFWEDQRYPLVLLRDTVAELIGSRLAVGPGSTVVDVGAGGAPYRPLFEAPGARYIACDIDPEAEVQIEPGVPVPLDDGIADVVVSFQVLEHVWDLDWYLAECRRLLKPDGLLLLSTHGVWLYHPHPTDFRRWTRDGLLEELRTRDLEVLEVRPLIGPLAWLMLFYLLAVSVTFHRLGTAGRLAFVPIGALVNALLPVQEAITPATLREENASTYVTVSRVRGTST